MKSLVMLFLSSCLGFAVASGFIAFIVLIGIIPRLTAKTRTARHIMLYEDMVVLGVTLGNLVYLYHISLPFTYIGMFIFSLSSGIFIGCLAGALAEVVNMFPILTRRLHLRKGLPYIAASIAFGKGIGTLIQFFVLHK